MAQSLGFIPRSAGINKYMESITDFIGGGWKDEMLEKKGVNLDKLTLEKIQKYAEKISGEWNGDDDGVMADRAGMADDIIEHIDAIKDLLKVL